jgi:photosystem II stability/assembly factor-like uncharacterized protein
MGEFINRQEGNLFLQTDPAEGFVFLTCTGVGDITIPKGARTIKYEQDLQNSGQLVPSGAIQGVPDFVTTSITRPLNTVNNYLHEIDCPFNARINWTCRGERDVFSNYELGALIFDSAFTGGTVANPLTGGETENDRINTTGDISGTRWTYVYPLAGARQTMTSTTEVYALAVVPSQCASRCGTRTGLGQIVWAGLESAAYTIGYLLFTDDYGATWQAPTNQPFSIAGDVSDIEIITMQSGYRIVCSRGSTEVGQPAEVSYSDDEGDLFTDVNVGAVNGQTIQALCRDRQGRLWAAASGGYVYRSTNLGTTWTTQEAGVETVQDLNDIVFYDQNVGYAVGNANAFIYTTDGTTFALRTGPAVAVNLLSVAVNYAGHVYVSTADARLFRSVDGGVTWETILDLNVGSINQVRFDNSYRYFGFFVWDNSTPVGTLYRSEDAGNNWAQVGTPATDYLNAGLNCIAIYNPNMAYMGGPAQGGTSFVAVFNRQA